MGKKGGAELVVIIFVLAVGISFVLGIGKVIALAYANSTSSNLTIYDDTDSTAGSLIRLSNQQITFFANFTNFTGSVINVTEFSGNCSIAFNTTGTYTSAVNMTYNASSLLWRYNTTFNRKGINNFRVICNSSLGNITLNDTFLITNTAPTISTTSGGSFVDFDGNTGTNDYWQCTEDTFCSYNFTANVTEPDTNDALTYDYAVSSNTTLTNFTLNSSTGILAINVTDDATTGSKQIELNVRDTESPAISRILRVNITAVNDIPYFTTLGDRELNITFLYSQLFQAFDEENDIPFNFTLNFTSCVTAEWSDRNNLNCTLFTENEYTFNTTTGALNITFTPSRNDVGNYTLNFTLKDSQNGTNSTLVNFSVYNVNVVPYFRYLCEDARETTENAVFTCIVNASDVDEINNLTLRAVVNGSTQWFTFNSTQTSMLTMRVNASTSFNATFLVNFTAGDIAVGNWSVNLTLNDTGSPVRANSTVFYFNVLNSPDGVSLQNLSAVNTFTSNNYTLFIEGYDDDLLIQDKNAYNEVLTFYSNDSRVFMQSVNTTSNKSTARIVFNGSNFTNTVHYINLTVNDSTQRTNSTLLILNFSTNTAPVWNSSLVTSYNLTEGEIFFLNLTANVTDGEGDAITFTNLSNNSFPNFAIDSTNGIVNFTPQDSDVGLHVVTINATDGKAFTSLNITFRVFNVNESPYILRPFTAGDNVTINSTTSNINVSEDSRANFVVLVDDEDHKIPSSQKSFHNENLSVNLTIWGPNTALFNLTFNSVLSSPNNRTQYDVSFRPNKSDVGSYNVTINISDISGLSAFVEINLTISAINHIPNLTAISNKTSSVNSSFSLDLNASDIEDGSDNGNLIYNITFIQGTDFIGGNATIFNITSGLLNITFNSTHPGTYRLNVTVNDSTGLQISRDFTLTVYGVPEIITAAGSIFNLSENSQSNLSFVANHTIQDNLTYYFYLQGQLRYNITSFGNGSVVNWSLTPTFTDETYGGLRNITLTVFHADYQHLNFSRNWSINITHTNAPVVFNGSLANQQKNYNQVVTVDLRGYFSDLDSNDSAYNETINFTAWSNMSSSTSISVRVVNGSILVNTSDTLNMSFSSNAEAFETFNITANDSVYSNVSNSFTIQFTVPSTTPTSSSSSSGGGGGGGTSSQIKPVSLNIIVPGPVTARKQDKFIVPISLVNTGRVPLSGIVLRNVIAKNGILRDDLIASFDKSFIESLQPGQKENLTLIVDVDTRETGLYEITLNGTSTIPSYSDTAKLYVNVREGDTVSEKISFTEEFIAQNPECIEIKELIDEARALYAAGDIFNAERKTEEALQACQQSISQKSRIQRKAANTVQLLADNISITVVVALLLGVGYYWVRRIRMQRAASAIS